MLLSLLVLLAPLLILVITRAAWVRSIYALPGPAPQSAIFGHLSEILRLPQVDRIPLVVSWFEAQMHNHCEHGFFPLRVFSPWLPFISRVTIIIWDPAGIKQMLSHKSHCHFLKGGSYDLAAPLIGQGLLRSSGLEWKTQRLIAEQGFRLKTLQLACSAAGKTTSRLFNKWDASCEQQSNTVDVLADMLKLTMDVLCSVGFSYDLQSVTDSNAPLSAAFNEILSILDIRSRNPLHQLWPPANRRLREALDRLHQTAEQLIEASTPTDGDLLSFLLSSVDEQKLSHHTVIDNIKTFLFAGHDTTASTLSWALYLLARHPGVQDRLQREVQEGIPEGGDVNLGMLDAAEMPYLNAVIKEVTRLYPAAGFTRRSPPASEGGFKVNGHAIPGGVEIMVLPHLVHRHPILAAGLQADSFLPERWLPEQTLFSDEEVKRCKDLYMPFSQGPRNCIGMRLAETEMRTSLALMVQRYRFKLQDEQMPPPNVVLRFTLFPERFHLQIERRST